MYRDYGKSLGFACLPTASQLMQDLLVDPDALKNERHDPGIYDEDGDYYPQYSDDPELIESIVSDSHPSDASHAGTMGQSESSDSNNSADSENVSSAEISTTD